MLTSYACGTSLVSHLSVGVDGFVEQLLIYHALPPPPCPSFLQAFVVDKDGNVVPGAANDVTFTITTGDTSIAFIGSGNGDPTCHTDDKSMVRPAYHGKVLGVFQDIGMVGSATVTVSADGLKSDSVKIDVSDAGAVTGEWWCAAGNTL